MAQQMPILVEFIVLQNKVVTFRQPADTGPLPVLTLLNLMH